MKKVTKVFSYSRFSMSGKAIAEALGVRRIKHHNSKWRPRHGSVVLNWGSSCLPASLAGAVVLNDPRKVAIASNKLAAFTKMGMHEVPIPDFCTDIETAREWAQEGVVICRTLLRANSGRGIVVAHSPDELVPAPMYTRYFKRKDEYRIHIIDGVVVDVQRKMRKLEVPDEEVNWFVRNHCNGFVFGRGGVDAPDGVVNAAIAAVQALGLDFGAVDVGYNERQDAACVFEVNTAPNLEGTTLEKYKEALRG